MVDGLMRCPGCGLGVHMVDGGCNVTTCRHASKHGGRYYYFCAHCKAECLDGESMCTSCPMHNDRETRVRVKARRERERESGRLLSLEQLGGNPVRGLLMVAACNAGMRTQSTQRLVRLPCAVPWSLVAGARARRAPAVIIFRFFAYAVRFM
jgi:hypothetical protein